jgi:hypothetical protein
MSVGEIVKIHRRTAAYRNLKAQDFVRQAYTSGKSALRVVSAQASKFAFCVSSFL